MFRVLPTSRKDKRGPVKELYDAMGDISRGAENNENFDRVASKIYKNKKKTPSPSSPAPSDTIMNITNKRKIGNRKIKPL